MSNYIDRTNDTSRQTTVSGQWVGPVNGRHLGRITLFCGDFIGHHHPSSLLELESIETSCIIAYEGSNKPSRISNAFVAFY